MGQKVVARWGQTGLNWSEQTAALRWQAHEQLPAPKWQRRKLRRFLRGVYSCYSGGRPRRWWRWWQRWGGAGCMLFWFCWAKTGQQFSELLTVTSDQSTGCSFLDSPSCCWAAAEGIMATRPREDQPRPRIQTRVQVQVRSYWDGREAGHQLILDLLCRNVLQPIIVGFNYYLHFICFSLITYCFHHLMTYYVALLAFIGSQPLFSFPVSYRL